MLKLGKQKKVRLTILVCAFLLVGLFATAYKYKFFFKADEISVSTPVILLPVDNERFVYTDSPLIQGKALPGSTITILIDNAELGQTTTDSSGNFYYKPQSPITQGIHALEAKDINSLKQSYLTHIEVNTSDPSKAILKSQNTQIIENDHPFYANGANDFAAIINLSESKSGVEKRFDDMEKAGIKVVRVINYMLRDMKLPDPISAPTTLVEDGGGLLAGNYVYRYTCANLSKNSNANNYDTAETLPSPATSSVAVNESQKVTLTMTACAKSYRYLIYRRNSTDPENSETYLGFAEAPAGQNATFIDDGSYRPAGSWPDPTEPPVLQVQARNASATTTLAADDYIYRYVYREQKKPGDGRNEKFAVGSNSTIASPTAQITVTDGQAVNISIPAQNSPWAVIYRRKATDSEGSEKYLTRVRNVNGTISYVDEGIAVTNALPASNTTAAIGQPAANETMDNPSTYGGKPYMTGFGNWNEDKLIDTDYALEMAQKHNIRLLFTFVDQHDNLTGGVREIARNCGTWNSNFFADTCSKNMYKEIIDKFTTRTSTITGRAYKDDPAIFAWEFINEPWETNGGGGFRTWLWEMGTYLKSKDPNHMLSSGDDGSIWFTHPSEGGFNGGNNHDFVMAGTPAPIDLLTWHGYPESSGFMFNHGYYGEFDPTNPTKRGGMDDAAAAEWMEKYGPVSGPISIDQAIKQLQLHAHYATLLNKPVVFGEWGVNWAASSGADWISRISSAILTSKPDIERIANIVPVTSFFEPLTDFWNTGTYTAALSLNNEERFNNNPSIKLEAKTINDGAGQPQLYNGVTSKKIPIKPNTAYWYEFTGKNQTSKNLEIKINMFADGVNKGSIGGNISQTTYNNGWRTITRFNNGVCEYITPADVNEINISATLINGGAGDYAYIGDIKLYELGTKADSNTTTFSATGWWALPDATGLGNAANTEALKTAAINFAKASFSSLSPVVDDAKPDAPVVNYSRSFTYRDKLFLTGYKPINSRDILINNSAENIVLSGSNWTKEIPLSFGENNIMVTSVNDAGISSDKSLTVTRKKPGDSNYDNLVNIKDFSSLMSNWNKSETANTADFNEDSKVGMPDFSIMMSYWGK